MERQMTSQSTHYAILDTNAGLLQWIGAANSEADALALCEKEINDADFGTESLKVYNITKNEVDQVLDWWENGASASSVPECLK